MFEYNLDIIEKIIRRFYSICVIKLLRSKVFGTKWILNDDFSININGYIFLEHCDPQIIDKEGKLTIKFKYIDTLYIDKCERLTSTYNFPNHCRSLSINNLNIKELKIDRIDTWLNLTGTLLTKLEIKECGEKCFIQGNLENLKTFAYIPLSLVNSYIFTENPFKFYTDNGYINLKFEDVPRHQIYLEFIMLITKKEITGIIEKNIADPNHFYGKLLVLMTSERKIFGAWEKWSSQYHMINWPDGFLNDNLKTSIQATHKFAL